MCKKSLQLLLETILSIIYNVCKAIPLIIFCYIVLGITMFLIGATLYKVTSAENTNELAPNYLIIVSILGSLGVISAGIMVIQEAIDMFRCALILKKTHFDNSLQNKKEDFQESEIFEKVLKSYSGFFETTKNIWKSAGAGNIYFGSSIIIFILCTLFLNTTYQIMIAAGILLTAAAIFIISGISLVKNSLLFKEKQDLIDKNIMNNSDISDSAEILLESQAVIIKCINIAVKFFTLIALFGFIGSFFWVIFLLIKMHSFFMYGILLFILGASSILPIKTFTQGLIELKNKDFIVKKNSENQTEDSIKAILDYQSAICAVLGKLYKSDVQFSLMAGISAIITGIIDFIIYPGHYLLGIFSIIMGMLAIGVGISVNKRVSDCQIKFNRIIEHLDFPEQKV